MTNAFSPNYKPSEVMTKALAEDIKAARLSKRQAENRARRMASDDPAVREQARDDLGPLTIKKRGAAR